MLYIDKHLAYRHRKALIIHILKKTDSTLIEIRTWEKNAIVCCIYKHPNVSSTEFKVDYLVHLLEKLSIKKNLQHQHFKLKITFNIFNFVGIIYSNSFHLTINTPTRITST